jgi:hypothetical protein
MSIYRGAGGAGDAVADSSSEALLIRELAVEVQGDVDAASASATAAASSASTASTQATNAANSATNAATSATNASNSASAAATSASNAATSATAAQTAETAAELAETNAETAETNAATSASAASTSATNASNSASAAATSATNASNSASAASTSATNAAASATSASGSASTATTQASNASTSASNAATSATSASNSATTATTQAGIATTQASNAATSATAASGSASSASTSATNAANSATAAATSATNAANSASTATTQATNASNSASAASTSATNAAASAASAAASYDSFDDRYLGVKTSAPTLDNDGNALVAGALYYNSGAVTPTNKGMWVYDGTVWIIASSASYAILTVFKYTATAAQTTFTGADDNSLSLTYTVGSTIITVNGVVMEAGTDVTASNGTSIVLSQAALAGDEVNIYAFSTFNLADMYTKAETDTFLAAKVTSVAGTAPVVSSGGITPTISMAAATTSVNGYLTSTDWNTFNGKYATGGALGTPSSGNLANCTFPTLNQNTTGSSGSCTGNAATATNVAYSGLTGTVPTWNQNTTGNAATATTATNQSGGTVSATSIAYSTTLTGGTGVVNLGSGQLYKTAGGLVGIGTTNPKNSLQVINDISGTGFLGNLYYDGAWKYIGNGFGNAITYASGNTIFQSAGNNTSGADAAATMSERMRIDSSGNVGIGVSTMGSKLVVNGNQEIAGGNFLSLYESTNNNQYQLKNNTNNLTFVYNTTERMRIDSSGNVGIGTSSPVYKLNVSVADTSNTVGGSAAAINITNSNSGAFGRTADLDFSIGGGTVAEKIAGLSAVYTNYTSSVGGALAFCTNNGSGSYAERMRITSAGNVGIGISTPDDRLSVDAGVTVGSGVTSGYSVLSFINSGTGSARYGSIRKNYDSPFDIRIRASNSGTEAPIIFELSNDTEAMRIDSTGSLFAGAPSQRTGAAGVTIGQNTTSLSAKNFYRINNRGADTTNTGTYTIGGMLFSAYRDVRNPSDVAGIWAVRTSYAGGFASDGALVFGTSINAGFNIETDGSLPTERMRIDASGNVGIGNSSPSCPLDITTSGTAFTFSAKFNNGNGNVGSITTSGSNTAFNTSSDYRLKENIAPMTGALGVVSQLKPVTYKWKSDGSDGQGFIAHELQAVVPDCVIGEKDGTRIEKYEISPAIPATLDEDGTVITEAVEAVMGEREVPAYQGIDTSFLVATLTAAIQEQQAMINELKLEVAALKGAR